MESNTNNPAHVSLRRSYSTPVLTEANSANELSDFEYSDFDNQARASRSTSLASTMGVLPSRSDQPSGELLQAIPKHRLSESGSDYASIFTEMQIRPERWNEVVRGILYPVRAKRIKSLKTATAAMIKDLTALFLRGYGSLVYHKQVEKWLVDESELQLAGKERLQFTHGNYAVDGPNRHFYAIMKPIWWKMRTIVFELKPAAKKRGQPKKNAVVQDDGASQGDIDTDMDGLALRGRRRPPLAVTQAARAENAQEVHFEQFQQQSVDRIEQEVNLSKRNGTWYAEHGMSAVETDEAVQDLVVGLHKIRNTSDPKAFTRAWDSNMGRLEEIEAIDELKLQKQQNLEQEQEDQDDSITTLVSGLEDNAPSKKVKLGASIATENGEASRPIPSNTATISGQALPILTRRASEQVAPRTFSTANLANEPFNTDGPPSILNRIGLGQALLIPPSISVYISTDPPRNPYHHNAYHWPCAPIGIADCKNLFDGIDMRADVVRIRGYIFSYGWHDMMRAIDSTDQGKRDGFGLLLQDIALAARNGVTKWRLKVLVLGVAPVYPSRV